MCVVFPYLCAAFLDAHRRALERFVERRLLGEHCYPGCHSARRNRRNCVEGGPSAAARDHSSGGAAVVVSQPNRWTRRTVAAWARADRDARTVGRFPRVLTGAAAVAGPRGVHGGGRRRRRRRRRGSARSAQHSSARGGGSRGARLAARWERHRAGLHAEAPR